MDKLADIFVEFFDASSVWSVVARGVVWLLIAGVIIASIDNQEKVAYKKAKSNLGILVLFIALSSGLFYFLFSFTTKS